MPTAFFIAFIPAFLIFGNMETIPKSACLKIGFIQKPYGVQGEAVLSFKEEFENSVAGASTLFLDIEGRLVPYFCLPEDTSFRQQGIAVIKFDWVDTKEQASRLVGLEVYLSKEDLLESEETDFGPMDLTGFILFDKNTGEIGPIAEVSDYAGNIVLTVESNQSELLIPFSPELVCSADIKNRRLVLDIPEGLFNLGE